MGSIKIGHRGGQNHKLTRDDIAERYRQAFGETL
jgi:adenosine kinase